MNPQHGIIGDVGGGPDLPQADPKQKDEALAELNKKAKYSRSKEFSELREKMEGRILFYQSYLPGGVPVNAIPEEERGKYWAIADTIIAELRMVIDMYDGAQEQLENDGK